MKDGDIVYCIDNKSKYRNTQINNLNKLEYDKPYTLFNANCGNDDVELKEFVFIYYSKTRFITEREYKLLKRADKIKKLL